MASLRPVLGTARELYPLVDEWVNGGGEPIVVRTSGSTGAPKDVRLSHGAVLASAQASLDRLGGPGRWISALPPTAVGGLQVLVRSVLAGVEPVYLDDAGHLGEAVESLGGRRTYASFVPTQLFRLIESGQTPLLARLDAILLGGAAVPASVLVAARDGGINLVRTYGMTETAGGCVYDGVPLEGVAVRIADGRVQIRGPVLFDGYGNLDREGDWFTTSDLGEIDADGRLRVLGRTDDVAISGGVNVPLPAVEALVREVAGVRDAAVVAVPDDEWGQSVCVVIVGEVDPDSVRLELRDLVQARGHPRAWVPRRVMRLPQLPLLPGGKVDRIALAVRLDGCVP